MALADDPWIAENSMIDPERLHALGVVTLWWNHSERNLFFIFCLVFNFTPKVGWILAHDIGDVSLASKMKEMMAIRPFEADVAALLTCCLDVYDACRLNRNTLTHFTASAPPEAPTNFDAVTFVRTKGPSGKAIPFPSSLKDIRRVAYEIRTLAIYLWQVYKALVAHLQGLPVSLPPEVAVPDLLWKPPPPTVPKPKRPPRPSAASRRKAALRKKNEQDRSE